MDRFAARRFSHLSHSSSLQAGRLQISQAANSAGQSATMARESRAIILCAAWGKVAMVYLFSEHRPRQPVNCIGRHDFLRHRTGKRAVWPGRGWSLKNEPAFTARRTRGRPKAGSCAARFIRFRRASSCRGVRKSLEFMKRRSALSNRAQGAENLLSGGRLAEIADRSSLSGHPHRGWIVAA